MDLPLHPRVAVLATHPAGLLALAKPEGVRAHPNGPAADPGALLHVPYDGAAECYIGPAGPCWHLLHRLDAPTSGVLLLATDAGLARALRALFAGRTVHKTYHAVVRGRPPRAEETWRDRLRTERRGGQLRAVVGGGEPALTMMRRLRHAAGPPPRSLLQLEPHTGRTHQLRVQAAARQVPIIGDATYGDFRCNRDWARRLGSDRLLLHSSAISLQTTWQGQALSFSATCPLPEIFTRALAEG
jgi:23S rRNA-/tRNA-specific pseudouridylate synthase